MGTKIAKFFLDKALLPINVKIEDHTGTPLLHISRSGPCCFNSILAKGKDGNLVAAFKSTFFSLGGKLQISDMEGREIGTIEGDWSRKTYYFTDSQGKSQGEIEHRSGGMVRDFLTTADDYLVRLFGEQSLAPILLAGTIVVDLLYHEG